MAYWNPQQPIGPSEDVVPPQQIQTPEWDRTKFRDAWMSSGIQNVPDMQNWLRTSGWGGHVGVGGSKGDVMQLPSGENIDAVLAAGLGGNRGGPQWTGRGEHGGGFTPFAQQQQGIGPSQGMMQGWGGGYNPNAGQQWGQGGMQGRPMQQGPDPRQMQMQMHQQFQNRQQQRRPGGIGPNYQMGQGRTTPYQMGRQMQPRMAQPRMQQQQPRMQQPQRVQYY